MKTVPIVVVFLGVGTADLMAQCEERQNWDRYLAKSREDYENCNVCRARPSKHCEKHSPEKMERAHKDYKEWLEKHQKDDKCIACRNYCAWLGDIKAKEAKFESFLREHKNIRWCKACSQPGGEGCEQVAKQRKELEKFREKHDKECAFCREKKDEAADKEKQKGGKPGAHEGKSSDHKVDEGRPPEAQPKPERKCDRCKELHAEDETARKEHRKDCRLCREGKEEDCEWMQEHERRCDEDRAEHEKECKLAKGGDK